MITAIYAHFLRFDKKSVTNVYFTFTFRDHLSVRHLGLINPALSYFALLETDIRAVLICNFGVRPQAPPTWHKNKHWGLIALTVCFGSDGMFVQSEVVSSSWLRKKLLSWFRLRVDEVGLCSSSSARNDTSTTAVIATPSVWVVSPTCCVCVCVL